MRTCTKCKAPKDEVEFYPDKNSKKGRISRCKDCIGVQRKAKRDGNLDGVRAKRRSHYEKNRERLLAKRQAYRKENLEEIRAKQKTYYKENQVELSNRKKQSKYGMTVDELKSLTVKQGGVCAICGGPGGKRGLCIDHDHESGAVRALLCSPCNLALGHLKDSTTLVQKALNYLKQHGK